MHFKYLLSRTYDDKQIIFLDFQNNQQRNDFSGPATVPRTFLGTESKTNDSFELEKKD